MSPSFFLGFSWEHSIFHSHRGFYWALEKSLFTGTAVNYILLKPWLVSLMWLLSNANSTQIKAWAPWNPGPPFLCHQTCVDPNHVEQYWARQEALPLESLFFLATANNRRHFIFLSSKMKENILSVFIALKPFHATLNRPAHLPWSPCVFSCHVCNLCGLEYWSWGAYVLKTSKNVWNCFITLCNLTPVGPGAQNLSDMDASAVSWQKLFSTQACRTKPVLCPSTGQTCRYSELALPTEGQGWSFPVWWKHSISHSTAGPASLQISTSLWWVLGQSSSGQTMLWRADHPI